MNKWFEQHASTEFALKQFQLDIERASWIVETALEWKDTKGGNIPDILLDNISKDLFKYEKKDSDAELHPADQLASALLGTASNLKLNVGNSVIEFDGKKLKKSMQQ